MFPRNKATKPAQTSGSLKTAENDQPPVHKNAKPQVVNGKSHIAKHAPGKLGHNRGY